MHELVLGSETDNALFARLGAAIRELGGTLEDPEWVLGGSQEITTYKISLPGGKLEAEAETYIGLTLRGPEALVSQIAAEIDRQLI